MSLIIPGARQMYKGHVLVGLAWLLGVALAYVLFWPLGIVLHVYCIMKAASPASPKRVAPPPHHDVVVAQADLQGHHLINDGRWWTCKNCGHFSSRATDFIDWQCASVKQP